MGDELEGCAEHPFCRLDVGMPTLGTLHEQPERFRLRAVLGADLAIAARPSKRCHNLPCLLLTLFDDCKFDVLCRPASCDPAPGLPEAGEGEDTAPESRQCA